MVLRGGALLYAMLEWGKAVALAVAVATNMKLHQRQTTNAKSSQVRFSADMIPYRRLINGPGKQRSS